MAARVHPRIVAALAAVHPGERFSDLCNIVVCAGSGDGLSRSLVRDAVAARRAAPPRARVSYWSILLTVPRS